MESKFTKGLLVLLIGFALLFIIRLIYGYLNYPSLGSWQPTNFAGNFSSSGRFDYEKKNYASKRLKRKSAAGIQTITVDQKYEKVGSIRSASNAFQEDEQKLRTIIKENALLIQFEQSAGLTGSRILNFGLGVLPEKFDTVISQVQSIGKLLSIQIDKNDKTNEYKELGAKKISLEKARNSLLNLKGKRGSIEEQIKLENRILEIENEIQAFGVKLGEFDEENEFCTLKYSLLEDRAAGKSIPFMQRLKVAFEWTVKYYFVLMLISFFGVLSIFLFLAVIQKVKWVQDIIRQAVNDIYGHPKKESEIKKT